MQTSHPSRRGITFGLAVALAGALAAACSADTSSEPPAAGGPPTPAATAGAPVHDGRPVEIKADDTIKFDVGEIHAKPGERLSVTLVNVGSMPKLSMGHNWVLLKSDADPTAFVTVAAEAAATNYVPSGSDVVLASTKLLGPNERDTVTFNAPTTPGRYEFLCSFPGHFQVGMRGVLIVA